jgi:DNA-binding NtrC family response regulator
MKVPEILVASSDLFNRRHVSDILNSLGFEARCASTLRECCEALARREVGLIFCDHQMSDGNYRDLLSAYRCGTDKPRVVVMSPDVEWKEVTEAMRLGAFHVISSPCRPADVEWMVIQAKRDERKRSEPASETGLARVKLTWTAMASGS